MPATRYFAYIIMTDIAIFLVVLMKDQEFLNRRYYISGLLFNFSCTTFFG